MRDLSLKQRFFRLFVCGVLATVIWFLPPNTAPIVGWHIFAVFIALILSFFLTPFPMGVNVLMGLVLLLLTHTIPIHVALQGFADSTVWLVVAAFMLACCIIHTGLGKRIALLLVRKLGHTLFGLSYAIILTELLLGPVVPSNTARGGGILAPIVNAISSTLQSPPGSSNRTGEYLMQIGAHSNIITAAMFLTGMAANPLIVSMANEIFGVQFSWGMWALGAIVPGLISLAILPFSLYFLIRPTLSTTQQAQSLAIKELQTLGRWHWQEILLMISFVCLIILWSMGGWHSLSVTAIAWLAICFLLLTTILSWDEFTGNRQAWDTLIWLGGLITIATALKSSGLIHWFAQLAQIHMAGLLPIEVFVTLALIYFYSMYGFSMLTAHLTALATVFLVLMRDAQLPPLLAIPVIAYFSNLCGCLTHYSTGSVVIYCAFGYVKIPAWLNRGFMISLTHLGVWLGLGSLWWHFLGWF